jgi:hypothetical protein
MINQYTLAQALKSVGNAEAFIGDPFTTGSMVSLGAIEGKIGFSAPKTLNKLTAPELTGDVAHQATVTPGEVQVTLPLISDGDLAALLAKISPTGLGGEGSSSPVDVFSTSLLILPRKQVGGGLSNVTTVWTRVTKGSNIGGSGAGFAPLGAVWLWRAMPNFDNIPFLYENGGKQVVDVTFIGMWYSNPTHDADIPEGHKVYTVGDPRRAGVAIPVLL